jgi:serine/threonine-protein kinase
MEDLIGKTLGQYRIVERLGSGGMADVYKAYQPSLGRYVAVKILPAVLSRDATFRARFEREARAVAQLRHPNVLTVFVTGEQDGITYIVMEYARGGTLKDRMAEPPSLEETVDLIGRVGGALAYAHRRGVIHRDVKPTNVLLTEEGWPLLADFGLAKMIEGSTALTASGVSVGTPEYMSPEQGQGLPVDHRTDIYSLGVVLYEMVTGQMPYTADTPMAVIVKHMTEPLPSPRALRPDLPVSIERVIVRAMAKAPEERYHSADEMAAALQDALRGADAGVEAALEEEDLPDSVVQPLAETPSPPRRRKAVTAVALAVLLLALGSVLAWALVSGLPDAVSSFLASPTATAPATATTTDASVTSAMPTSPPPTRTATPRTAVTPTPVPTATPVVAGATPTQTATPTVPPSPVPNFTAGPTSTPTRTPTESPTSTPRPSGPAGMVWIPGGAFLMGSNDEELATVKGICREPSLRWPCPDFKEEQPQREVETGGFWMDQNEVTNRQFEDFVKATGYQTEAEGQGDAHHWRYYYTAGKADHPVVGVSWHDADAYCAWLGKRLPTEAEWEKAARGADGRLWPWGGSWDAGRLNSIESGINGTEAVGARGGELGRSPYGLSDMAGNVWEWTADWWGWYEKPHRPPEDNQGWGRVIRGGSWRKQGHETRTAFRGRADPGGYSDDIGFRCAGVRSRTPGNEENSRAKG